MNYIYQKTIAKSISFNGIGLHSGLVSKVKILPAQGNVGIVFKRIDLEKNNTIEANFKNVCSAKLSTTLKNKYGAEISTVEHLMAAFYITGVDNAIVEIDNSEVPIMDGSSKDFIKFLDETGYKVLDDKRKFIKIKKEISLKDKQKTISISPNNFSFEVDFQLSYKNSLISDQKNKINFQTQDLKEVYTSRTFCLHEDIEKIKKAGLAKGGSLDNAIVVKNNEVLNEDGLRNKKEFVNHKILDLAGDFMLSGYRIFGSIKCFHGGHELSNKFLREVFSDKSNYEVITFNNEFKNELRILTKLSDANNKIAVNA